MLTYVWSVDKSRNKWPESVSNILVNKDILPGSLIGTDKVELMCDIHGPFSKRVSNIYYELNEFDHPMCPKCSRIEATKKTEQTNLEKYGTKAPAQNAEVLNKMRNTNKERYGFEFVGSNPDFMDKIRQANMEKYGVEYAILNPEVKEKANQRMIDLYGTQHALQNEDSFNKFKSTMQDRYDTDFSLQNKELRDRFTQTMQDKYGVEHALQSDESKQKMKETNMKNYNSEFVSQTYDGYVSIKRTKGEEPVSKEMFDIANDKELLSNYIDSLREKDGEVPTIKKLSDALGFSLSTTGQKIIRLGLQDKIRYLGGESYGEHEIMDFLDHFSVKYNHRYTKVGPELDIYLPDYDIGIEFNGLYWHSDLFKDKDYHLAKHRYYKEIGTKVIHIYEDEWAEDTTQEILKSIILSACNISVNKTVEYARKLKLVELDHSPKTLDTIRDFYNTNHLQGYRNSFTHIALVDENNDIIECMSFGYAYFGNMKDKNKYQFELIRHCTKLYHNVVGGKERIFKYLLTKYPYDKNYDNYIITYCDIDKFSGDSYEKLGFSFADHKIQVWGIEDAFTRRVFRDPTNNDYFKTLPKIYGCGNNVYIYNI